MTHTRFRSAASITTLVATTLMSLWPAMANAGQLAEFEFLAHCQTLSSSSSSSLAGPLPNIDFMVPAGDSSTTCDAFAAGEAQVIETKVFANGDVIDFDINLKNPEKLPINRVRIWLAYDPAVLSGTLLEIDKAFPTITATERGFYNDEGYMKIAARSTDSAAPDAEVIHIARVKMKVISSKGTSTALSFFEAKGETKNRTVAVSGKGKDELAILSLTQPSLLVKLDGTDSPAPAASSADSVSSGSASTAAQGSVSSVASSASSSSVTSSSVESSVASTSSSESSVTSTSSSVVSSSRSSQQSLITIGGLSSSTETISSSSRVSSVAHSASAEFQQLQVQNLSIGTEGNKAMLSWSPVFSDELKGYNLYYGTTSGVYTRRRSLTKESRSEIVENLPEGQVHYFALRALSEGGGESQYSQEVAIVIGRPETSTAPLVTTPPPVAASSTSSVSSASSQPVIRPPVTSLPKPTTAPEGASVTAKPTKVAGDTGVGDWVNAMLLLTAVAGTWTFRRQLIPSSLDV